MFSTVRISFVENHIFEATILLGQRINYQGNYGNF
jgi:hypothetical protein